MNKLIVLNHKMNLIYDDVYEYIDTLNKIETDNNLIICPSNIYLEEFVTNSSWGIGSQNVYSEISGAYTGEISTNQLKSIGVEYSIIGHYERRKYFHETDTTTNNKLKAALDGNIIPIVCITEETEEDITNQLTSILKDINHIEFIIFAYEPPSLIGGDQNVDIEELQSNINYIHDYLHEKYHSHPSVIYGGSVTQQNIKDIFDLPTIDGVMIGEKSSDITNVIQLINEVKK